MFRPTSRRRSQPEQITLNLVPILDTLVTLIAFLLYSMAFLALVHIDSPAPVSAQASAPPPQSRPLQLTLSLDDKASQIWSPANLIETAQIPHLSDGKPNVPLIREVLLKVKRAFPTERLIVFAPHGDADYEVLIGLMDAVRVYQNGDPPLFIKDAAGTDVVLKELFPDIVFGNLIRGNE